MSIDLSHLLYIAADQLSNGINPIFVALILQEPLITGGSESSGAGLRSSLGFYVRSLLAVGVAVVLAEMGKSHRVWPGHPYFPSGHATFASAAASAIIMQRGGRWAWMVVPLALLMGASLAYGHWHTPDEVAAGLVLGPVVAWIIMRITRGWRKR